METTPFIIIYHQKLFITIINTSVETISYVAIIIINTSAQTTIIYHLSSYTYDLYHHFLISSMAISGI